MRRPFICAAGALAAIAFTGGEVAAQDKVAWDFSVWGNPRPFTIGIESIAEHVKEKTGGNFVITIHYGEAVSPARENLDAVSIGSVDGAHVSPSYHPGKTPLFGVLDLPFVPSPHLIAQERVREAFYNDYGPAREELERWNALAHFTNLLPNYEFMGRGSQPGTLEDWRGKRVRALGGQGDAMRAIGAVPTTVTAPETYSGLERGVIDAIGFPFSYAFGVYRLHEVAHWYTYGIGIGAVHSMVAFNRDAWDALPAEWRQLLIDAKPKAYDDMRESYEKADQEWVPAFERAGVVRIEVSEEDRARFAEIGGAPVWEKWVEEMEGKGLPGREALDFVLEQSALHAGS